MLSGADCKALISSGGGGVPGAGCAGQLPPTPLPTLAFSGISNFVLLAEGAIIESGRARGGRGKGPASYKPGWACRWAYGCWAAQPSAVPVRPPADAKSAACPLEGSGGHATTGGPAAAA